jgi:hypothetical protein
VLEGRQGLLRDPPLRRAAAAAIAACLLLPATAQAHGIVQRANLPIPEWLFGWAAAIVLVVSFVALAVLWPKPKLEGDRWRPLPGPFGRALGSPVLEGACRAVGLALLVLVVVAGLAGTQSPLDNFAPTFVFIVFWVGLAFASAIFGNLFAAFSPWRALGRLGRARRPYPERLGRWPAAAGLVAFTWIELISGWGEEPRTLALAVLGYTALTLVAQAVYGVDAWSRRGEAFAVYFDLFGRIAPFERRDGIVGVRPLLAGLPRLDPVPGTVALLAVMIGTVTFDGFSQSRLWADLTVNMGESAEKAVSTLGLLAGVMLVGTFYTLGVAGARSVGGDLGARRLRGAFIHSLVPIALVYVAAHYLTFLLFEGQSIAYLVSDPLGEGWDLFGTAGAAINYGVVSQNQAWYLQVGFVVAGHVAALVLAHDRALALYPGSRRAARSQYWMLLVMVGFTTLALWLLSAAQG